MLPKRHKISRAEFPSYKEQKNLWAGKVLRVQAYKGEVKDNVSTAVVVSKKQSTSAVERNKFKRNVFSVLERVLPQLQSLTMRKYVFFPKMHLREINRADIEKDIKIFIETNKRK